MKNLDVLIFTLVVIVCFVSFFISTFKVFEKNVLKEDIGSNKRGIISRFLAYLESLVAD